jgi:hypothetical protein
MTVVFDYAESAVYVEDPNPKAEDSKIYYYQYKGANKQEGHSVVNLMRRMYNLGKDHRSKEIREVLGIH